MMEFLKKIVFLLERMESKFSAYFTNDGLLNEPHRSMSLLDFDIDKLLTRMAVVGKLGISERTYSRWVQQGILVPIKIGNKHFYEEKDLKDAILISRNRGHV